MLTFTEFLAEKFYKGTKGKYDYTEVYVNPSKSEMTEIAHGDPDEQIGAWVVGKNLYVWDRHNGEHHDVKALVGADSAATPLYLYYNPRTNVLAADPSSFSMFSMGHSRINSDEILAFCQKHPAFKAFKVTDFDTFFRDQT